MLNIELDGIYCKKCHDFHPTLCWHEAYDDYVETKEDAVPKYKKWLQDLVKLSPMKKHWLFILRICE